MRNLGVIVLLVIFGMSLWKASDRYRPVPFEPEPVASQPQPVHAEVDSVDIAPVQPVSIPAEQQSAQIEVAAQQDISEEPRVVESTSKAVKPRLKTRPAGKDEKSFNQLLIPSLKLNASVVSKPYTELSWDLTTLGQDVAHLRDIPNQVSENNIVMAGHVTVYDGSNGPFRYLWRMEPGDQIILKEDNVSYTYIVREHVLVYPEESSVLEDSQTPRLTLITCTTWDEETLSYLRRRVIVAELESVEYQQIRMD
jgi:LPXTG-site transpeptidase (sortase) family protein